MVSILPSSSQGIKARVPSRQSVLKGYLETYDILQVDSSFRNGLPCSVHSQRYPITYEDLMQICNGRGPGVVDDGVIRIAYGRARFDASELVYGEGFLHGRSVRVIPLGQGVDSIGLEAIGGILSTKPGDGQAKLPEGVGRHNHDVAVRT